MPKPALTPKDIEQRTPVWLALSQLWGREELDDRALYQIAEVMVDSGYSPTELRVICDVEVAPIMSKRLKLAAEERKDLDPYWLREQILTELAKPPRWQDALFGSMLNPWRHMHIASQWPILMVKFQLIRRMQSHIEL